VSGLRGVIGLREICVHYECEYLSVTEYRTFCEDLAPAYSHNEAGVPIELWRIHYNTMRPQYSIGRRPPTPRGLAGTQRLTHCAVAQQALLVPARGGELSQEPCFFAAVCESPLLARSGGLLRRRNSVANGAKRTSAGITLSRLSRTAAKDHLSLSHGITLAASLIRSAETSSGRDRLHAIFIRSIHQRP
jgi:hypothetical protein